jgi:hypothetical protein
MSSLQGLQKLGGNLTFFFIKRVDPKTEHGAAAKRVKSRSVSYTDYYIVDARRSPLHASDGEHGLHSRPFNIHFASSTLQHEKHIEISPIPLVRNKAELLLFGIFVPASSKMVVAFLF